MVTEQNVRIARFGLELHTKYHGEVEGKMF